jgi:hypothetical protein
MFIFVRPVQCIFIWREKLLTNFDFFPTETRDALLKAMHGMKLTEKAEEYMSNFLMQEIIPDMFKRAGFIISKEDLKGQAVAVAQEFVWHLHDETRWPAKYYKEVLHFLFDVLNGTKKFSDIPEEICWTCCSIKFRHPQKPESTDPYQKICEEVWEEIKKSEDLKALKEKTKDLIKKKLSESKKDEVY